MSYQRFNLVLRPSSWRKKSSEIKIFISDLKKKPLKHTVRKDLFKPVMQKDWSRTNQFKPVNTFLIKKNRFDMI